MNAQQPQPAPVPAVHKTGALEQFDDNQRAAAPSSNVLDQFGSSQPAHQYDPNQQVNLNDPEAAVGQPIAAAAQPVSQPAAPIDDKPYVPPDAQE